MKHNHAIFLIAEKDCPLHIASYRADGEFGHWKSGIRSEGLWLIPFSVHLSTH